jgi:hypothetical protein
LGSNFLIDRPVIIAIGFLSSSLGVMGLRYFMIPLPERNWVILVICGVTSALSAFTLFWVIFKYNPAPPKPPTETDVAIIQRAEVTRTQSNGFWVIIDDKE